MDKDPGLGPGSSVQLGGEQPTHTTPSENRNDRTALLVARDHGQELMSTAASRDAVVLGWWLHREADIALATPGITLLANCCPTPRVALAYISSM